MKSSIRQYVSIAYVQFKTNAPYRPRTFTVRLCAISTKRNDAAVKAFAMATAKRWKEGLESDNIGLQVIYSVKVETIGVAGIDVLDKDV